MYRELSVAAKQLHTMHPSWIAYPSSTAHTSPSGWKYVTANGLAIEFLVVRKMEVGGFTLD